MSTLREYLKHILSGHAFKGFFIFRRVDHVYYEKPRYTKFTLHEEQTPLNTIYGISKADRDRHVQVDCEFFNGTTEKRSLRNEVFPMKGKPVIFDSNSYGYLSFENDTFGQLIKGPAIAPFEGDLLCMLIKSDTPRFNNVLRADTWFIASEQFLKAWTAIMFDMHDSLTSLLPKQYKVEDYDDILRSKMFTGNTLRSNTWLAKVLAAKENNESLSKEEMRSMYYHLRTDPSSIMYTDIWACMVLMGRYGECPTSDNVPNNKEGLQRKKWNLPKGFIYNLFSRSDTLLCYYDESDVCTDSLFEVIEDRDLSQKQPLNVEIKVKLSAKQIVVLIDWNDDKDDGTF